MRCAIFIYVLLYFTYLMLRNNVIAHLMWLIEWQLAQSQKTVAKFLEHPVYSCLTNTHAHTDSLSSSKYAKNESLRELCYIILLRTNRLSRGTIHQSPIFACRWKFFFTQVGVSWATHCHLPHTETQFQPMASGLDAFSLVISQQ